MKRRTLLAASAAGFLFSSTLVWANENVNPYDWIVQLGNRILDEIKSNESLRDGNIQRIRALVDKYIEPNVDFRMVTRMTVGFRWRQATPEQREQLQDLFRQLLIRVYAGALKQITDQVCVLKPQRSYPVSDDMVINVLLQSPKGSNKPIALSYRLYKNKQGEWKIIDMNVEGIWMVENYHEQFASVLEQDGIDGLIKLMKSKIEQNG